MDDQVVPGRNEAMLTGKGIKRLIHFRDMEFDHFAALGAVQVIVTTTDTVERGAESEELELVAEP